MNGNVRAAAQWAVPLAALVLGGIATAFGSDLVKDWRSQAAIGVKVDQALVTSANAYTIGEQAVSMGYTNSADIRELRAITQQQYAEILRHLARIEKKVEP